MRSRLESPARRRNSSAESPGPSNVMSVVQRALQPALQPPMHPPLQSQLHNQLEMQSHRHLCLAKLCNLLETELRCPPSSQLGSQLRTRPRAHDRCLLTYPAIFSLFFESNSMFSNSLTSLLANFRGLVLGGLEARFRNQVLVAKHLTRSTRFTFLCTTPT